MEEKTAAGLVVYRLYMTYEVFDAGCPPVDIEAHYGIFSTREKAMECVRQYAVDNECQVDINTLEISGLKSAWTMNHRFHISDEEVV